VLHSGLPPRESNGLRNDRRQPPSRVSGVIEAVFEGSASAVTSFSPQVHHPLLPPPHRLNNAATSVSGDRLSYLL
jgi:hypothetical protein